MRDTNELYSKIIMLEEQVNERRRATDRIEDKLDNLSDEVASMRSFAAGVSFAFSAIAAVVAAFWEKLTGN